MERKPIIPDLDPETYEYLKELKINAENSYIKREFREAIEYCDKILETVELGKSKWHTHMYVLALNNKGMALGKLEEYEEAIKCYDEVLNIKSTSEKVHVRVLISKGFNLSRLKKDDEAVKCYDEALKIDPNSKEAWNNRGWSFGQMRKYMDAIECYNKALEIDPDFKMSKDNKEATLEKLKVESIRQMMH